MKQARSYSEERCSTTDLNDRATFPLQICNTDPQLIRFGLNLIIVIKRLIILMSNLLVKQSKIAAVTVQMATEKLVYVRIEQLLFGFKDINAIAMTLWRINHPAPT